MPFEERPRLLLVSIGRYNFIISRSWSSGVVLHGVESMDEECTILQYVKRHIAKLFHATNRLKSDRGLEGWVSRASRACSRSMSLNTH